MQTDFDFYDWERGALTELYFEYRSISQLKKLELKPAVIAFMDSETHWGRWDPMTRTISLSRKLVRGHSWSQVVGILRHELAHQWADETPGRMDGDLPHGERFRLACRKVGVPEEFSKASAQLQEHALDWRLEKRDEASERLLDRVRKLLSLATSSNEHEALLAMNKVRELYAKYNLEQAEGDARSHFAHITICHGKKRIEAHQEKIMGILVGHFFVQVLFLQQFDAKTGKRHRAMEIIGTRENALMAEYVYHFLLQQTDYWVREASRNPDLPLPRDARKSYRLGLLEGFAEKLRHSERPVPRCPPLTPTIFSSDKPARQENELTVVGTAVARFKKDPRLDDYLSEIYPRLRTRGSVERIYDEYAFIAGKKIGKTLTLNKAVATDEGNRGRLLR